MILNIKRVTSKVLNSNCYLLELPRKKYVVIDPSIPLKTLARHHVKDVVGVILTHGHYDHIKYLEDVVNKYNCKVYCTDKCLEKIRNDSYNLSKYFGDSLNISLDDSCFNIIDGDSINIMDGNDKYSFKVLYTPGHSSCSICIVVGDVIFTGDTLFKKSIGRCDLYSGDESLIENSLKEINRLNGDCIIYPGHFDDTTLDFERKYNRLFFEKITN